MPEKKKLIARRLVKIGLMVILVGLFFYATRQIATAQNTLGDEWYQFLTDLPSFQAEDSEPGEALAIRLIQNAIAIVRNILGAAALITGTIYATLLILSRGKEDSITKNRKNFVYVLMGFVILIIAENVANILNPEIATNQALIDFDAGRDQLRDIVDYISWIAGSIVVLFMTINGVRMITAGDNTEAIEKNQKALTWSLMGMMVILLARNIVNAVYVLNTPDQISPGSSENAITQIAGVIRLILVFLGPVAVVFTMYAGFLYLSALDKDDPKQKAQRMLVTGIVSIVIIYASFALVSTLTTQDFDPTDTPGSIDIEGPGELDS